MINFYNKHYIRVEGNLVTKGFSDAFESPLDTDILINEKGGRHFEFDGMINPSLFDDNFCHLYRYENGSIRKATSEELSLEWESIKPEPVPSEMELVWQAITDLEIKQMEAEFNK